jgi:hypothetical protein
MLYSFALHVDTSFSVGRSWFYTDLSYGILFTSPTYIENLKEQHAVSLTRLLKFNILRATIMI